MSLERFESVAQGHAVRAPVVFDRALPFQLLDEKGNSYIDFSNGGYGHNNLGVHTALIDHLSRERIIQACDRTSVVRRQFVEAFGERILGFRPLMQRLGGCGAWRRGKCRKVRSVEFSVLTGAGESDAGWATAVAREKPVFPVPITSRPSIVTVG